MRISSHILSRRSHRGFTPLALALTLLPGTLVLVPSVQAARIHQVEDEYKIVRTYKSGTTDRYKMTLTTTINGPMTGGQDLNVIFSTILKEFTKEAKETGEATVVNEFEEAHAKAGDVFDQDIPGDQLPKVTNTIDKTGKVVSSKSEGGGGPFGGGGGQMQMISSNQSSFYPPKAVKVGESWDIKQVDDKKGTKVIGKATLVAKEMLDGVETLKVKAETDTTGKGMDGMDVKIHFEGIAFLETKMGRTAKLNGKLDGISGPFGKAKAEISMVLMPEKKADAGKDVKK